MEEWSLLSKEWLEGTKGAGRQGKGDVEVTRWRDGHGWSREVAVEMFRMHSTPGSVRGEKSVPILPSLY